MSKPHEGSHDHMLSFTSDIMYVAVLVPSNNGVLRVRTDKTGCSLTTDGRV